MKIKIFEAFAGYGSQSMALELLKQDIGFDYEVVGISEIDKNAIKGYYAVRDTDLDTPNTQAYRGYKPKTELLNRYHNFGDISKIDWQKVPDFNLFTYSFPCTDISHAGAQKGFSEKSGTRSSLLWECIKAIRIKRPKYLLLENVKALISAKFAPDFKRWLSLLEQLGYSNFTQVLNAKNYGIPQNRERVFVVSILDGGVFYFPKPVKLKTRLRDFLEPQVDKSFYLAENRIKALINRALIKIDKGSGLIPNFQTENGISGTITTYSGNRDTDTYITDDEHKIKINQLFNLYKRPDKKFSNVQTGRVYGTDGLSPCLTTNGGGDREIKIYEPRIQPIVPHNKPSKAKLICPTITTSSFEENNFVINFGNIRKLTPRECYRLMGVPEYCINRLLNSDIAKTKHYTLAGNSIVIPCLYHIFKSLFTTEIPKNQQLIFF